VPRAIVLNRDDNVATLIDTGRAGDECALSGEAEGTVTLLADVPFGHKTCIREMAAGSPVLKYGQVIGNASRRVAVGEHVHTQNVESARGRGDRVGSAS
jgi:altronate dehydratase small subunit